MKGVGLDHLPVLPAPLVWGLSYLVNAYWVDLNTYPERKADTWSTLFPNIEEEPWHGMGARAFNDIVHTPEMKTWRNAWCDVHNLVTHIDHRRDVFVTTNTRDYQRNSERLRDLGVTRVVTPEEARALVEPRRNLH